MENTPQLTTHEWSTITNSLRIAAEAFDGHAEEFGKINEENCPPLLTVQGAKNLVKQFELQAKDARELRDKIEEAVGV